MSRRRTRDARDFGDHWACERARAPSAAPIAQRAAIEVQIERYAKRWRPAIRRFAAQTPQQSDLLFSFPAACVALASARGCALARSEAVRLVRLGAPLAQVAEALDLPIWMKRLPPEAIHCGLPERIAPDSRDAAFGRLIANAIPAQFTPGDCWLETILTARRAGDDAFAVWLALQLRRGRMRFSPAAIALMAAFAFFSARPDTLGHSYIQRPWTSAAALEHVAVDAQLWLMRIILVAQAQERAQRSCWSRTHRVNGYAFAPLETFADLAEEARFMRHCIASYADRVALGYSRVYSVRDGGRRVATLEVCPTYMPQAPARMEQICGPGNVRPAEEVIAAARAWIDRVQWSPSYQISRAEATRIGRRHWRAVFAPYWAEKAPTTFLQAEPPDLTRAGGLGELCFFSRLYDPP